MIRLKSFVFEGIHGITDQLKTLKEEIKRSKSKKVYMLKDFKWASILLLSPSACIDVHSPYLQVVGHITSLTLL